ncbi:MAG TPA: hypothetical protein VMR50_10955 [Myxococcota bacterium]|nr:hypothetical protein [Myxococcota bacterium]
MRRALTWIVIAAALAVLPTAALAHIRTHVHDVRVGAHEGYDRVVVELDGAADIAWERGPEPNAETFYLDADLGRRERVVATKLSEVGTVTLRAMRVGTTLVLEPRERRVRAYLLAKPTRLVIDIAPPGPGAFEVPAGLTPLAPASSVESLKSAPVPGPKSEPEEAEPEPEPAPVPAEEVAPEGPPPESQAVAPKHEPLEGAVESQPSEPPSEMDANAPAPEATAPAEEPAPEAAAPEASAPEAAPAEAKAPPEPPVAATPPAVPSVAPIPTAAPEGGFPWLLVLAAIAAVAGVGWLGMTLGRSREQPAPRLTPARARPTPLGVDAISLEELRRAADPASRIEQRLDDEVRARVALEEKLVQAGEELKVLRDRLHRIERKRDEAL